MGWMMEEGWILHGAVMMNIKLWKITSFVVVSFPPRTQELFLQWITFTACSKPQRFGPGTAAMHQEAPISMLCFMAVKKGENAVGLSRRFSLIVLQVSLDSDFQFTPVVFKIQMCEYFILFISLDSPKNFGLSWIILSHYVMRSISFSQQNEKLSQKTGNKLIQNA